MSLHFLQNIARKKHQLVVTGNITSNEFKKAQEYFSAEGIEIIKGITKAVEPIEIIQILFRDFDAYTFLRDGILFSFLAGSAKKIFSWFKQNVEINRQPKSIWMQVIFEKNGDVKLSVNLYLPADENKIETILEDLKERFPIDYADRVEDHETWAIGYNREGTRIEIFKL